MGRVLNGDPFIFKGASTELLQQYSRATTNNEVSNILSLITVLLIVSGLYLQFKTRFEKIYSSLNLSKSIQIYMFLSEPIWIYLKLSEHIWTYLNLSKLILTCLNRETAGLYDPSVLLSNTQLKAELTHKVSKYLSFHTLLKAQFKAWPGPIGHISLSTNFKASLVLKHC